SERRYLVLIFVFLRYPVLTAEIAIYFLRLNFFFRKCNGMRIYRISDELWFWSHDAQDVTLAWESLHTYGSMVGLKVNPNRSGSVSVFSGDTESRPIPGPAPLPQRTIHWGYLQLHSTGIFHIDQASVEKFLGEMKGL